MLYLVSVLLVLLIAVSISEEELYDYDYEFDHTEEFINMSHRPFTLNYPCLKKKRDEMLIHYGHLVSKEKVEKRSELSLEEFWDLYDGKW